MKKLFATTLVLGALLSANNIYANGNTDHPAEKPARHTQVSFDNVHTGARLYVKDKEGELLFSEVINSDGDYSRTFDFSSLPDKDYYFEIDKKGFITIYPFTIKNDVVELHDELKTSIFKPLLIARDEQVKLMRSIDKRQTLNVEIYYQGRELVLNETIRKDGMVGKLYDFSNSPAGDYLFVIDYDDRSLSETVHIQTYNQ